MLLSIIRYLKGYLKIRIIGYSPERFLNACSHRGIYLWDLKSGHGAYETYITIQGFRKLKPIIKKTGTKVVITGRFGLPFFLHRYRKRKVFFIGAFVCTFLIYLMSLFIWNIDITGNISRTDETLLSFLETRQVVHGMKKSNVDCARIVKDIRKEYNDIVWVSASIRGTRLIIQVKENEDSFVTEETNDNNQDREAAEAPANHGTDIVADQDCVITEIVTRKGTPLVHVGDTVKKGDILVSGRVEIHNDAQEVTGYQYQESDADIRGQTILQYETAQSLTYEEKEYTELKAGEEVKKEEIYLKIGDRILCLGNIENKYKQAEYYCFERQFTLGPHFVLPVSYGVRTVRPYRAEEISYTSQELQKRLSAKFHKDCRELEKKGVEIIENNVKIYTEQTSASAKGSLTIITGIGKTKDTEILEVPEGEDADNAEREDTKWE